MSRYQPCPHKNCLYRAVPSALNECDYALITGLCRTAGLTREQARDKRHCPKFEPKAKRKARRVTRAARYDWDRGRELYQAGASDRQIAKALGCSYQAVQQWRKKNELPMNRGGT